MKFDKYYNVLCKPAKFYFVISVVMYLIVFIQNITTPGKFSLGLYSCHHEQTPLILIFNALYILLWTYILNVICSINTTLSWIIVLFPFVLSLFILGYIMFIGLTQTSTKSCSSCNKDKPQEVDMYSISYSSYVDSSDYSQYGSPY